jgi:hypothetical protein
VGVLDSRQVGDRLDAWMTPVVIRRAQEQRCSDAHVVKQLVEYRASARIGGQARIRLADGVVGSQLEMATGPVGRRHDVLPSFQPWVVRTDRVLPDAVRFREQPGLEKGEGHRDFIMRGRESTRQAADP